MSVSWAISKLRYRTPGGGVANRLALILDALKSWPKRISRWLTGEVPEGAEDDSLAGCPEAFAGLNLRLVQETWRYARKRTICKDGRLRLAGEETLDVCVTPAEFPRAIWFFARWLDYLAADGIGLEIRKLDGWRTCAVVDGIEVPIRIRERLMRVRGGSWLSARLERLLGGRIPSVLVPSGRLELQLLRMGVSFASFPIEDALTAQTLAAASTAIREMAKRKVGYQERMHAVAVAEVSRREVRAANAAVRLPAPAAHAPAHIQPVPAVPSLELLTGIAALSAMGAGRLERLLESMEATLRSFAEEQSPRRDDTAQMAASMLSLAQAITVAADAQRVASQPGFAVVHDSGVDGAQPIRRSRRQRHVA